MQSVVKALLVAIGVTAVAMPALAHDRGWEHGRHHRHHHHGFGPRAVVVERPVMVEVVEIGISFIPYVGTAVALLEAATGRDLFGYALDPIDRGILAAGALLPFAARFVKGGKNGAVISRGFIGSYNITINDGPAFKVRRVK